MMNQRLYDQDELREILGELHREMDMRLKVYPEMVKRGKLSQKQSDHRVFLLGRAIAVISNAIEDSPKPPKQLNLLL